MEKLLLRVANLSVKIKHTGRLILDNVSFDLFSGDVLRISGLNGSGKSTLLNIIYGARDGYECSGEIYYYPYSDSNLLSMTSKQLNDYRSLLGFVRQRDDYDGLNRLTVSDLISNAVYGTSMSEELARELFEKYLLDKDVKLNSIPGKMSGGQQRMLSIFLGLICGDSHSLMLVDEPLNNLDFENVMKISDLLNDIRIGNPSTGMIMITHCKIITCITRERGLKNGKMDNIDSEYVCHHCMGDPDCNLYYLKKTDAV